ncbi:MAG TPA: carboxymuconolactone decarboxylase family protein [Nocardioides sp.]|uniref:carboxymuconolactone decarboxylase family protein n=1 Tax=Nocardioides sp. TaxID=35761 RepID=UPI002E35263F|nr:carboxymuconolactone decarboxylase family protein [Nocardioides sp.]HEX5090262.1 carboxymuconolactone decarboxylase family protein [Nocardioides sp.]
MTTESFHKVPTRLDVEATVPGFYKAMAHLDTAAIREADRAGIPMGLRDLLRLRASQINGCAYCVDMHTHDAAENGESQQRIHAVSIWAESPFFTEKERAAFAFTETVTRVADTHVPASDYDAVAAHWSDEEVGALLGLIVTINAWNGLAVASRAWEPKLEG